MRPLSLLLLFLAIACGGSQAPSAPSSATSMSGDWVIWIANIIPVDTLDVPCHGSILRVHMVESAGQLSGSYADFGRGYCRTRGPAGAADTVLLADGQFTGTVQRDVTHPDSASFRIDLGTPPLGYLAGYERSGSFYGDGIVNLQRLTGELVPVRMAFHAFQ